MHLFLRRIFDDFGRSLFFSSLHLTSEMLNPLFQLLVCIQTPDQEK